MHQLRNAKVITHVQYTSRHILGHNARAQTAGAIILQLFNHGGEVLGLDDPLLNVYLFTAVLASSA